MGERCMPAAPASARWRQRALPRRLAALGVAALAACVAPDRDTPAPVPAPAPAPREPLSPTTIAGTTVYLRPQVVSPALDLHARLKQQAAALPEAQAAEWLRGAGLSAEAARVRPDSEVCAIYLSEPLTDADLGAFARRGIRFRGGAGIGNLPGRHAFAFRVAEVPYARLAELAGHPRVVRIDSLDRAAVPFAASPPEAAPLPFNDVARSKLGVDEIPGWPGLAAVDGTGVVVAVADSSLDLSHPDLPVPLRAVDVTDDPFGDDVASLVSGHGTHVAGTVLGRGTASDARYAGIAPGADLLFYKIGNDVNGSTTWEHEVAAMEQALLDGADVFSMSYGGRVGLGDGSEPHEQAVDMLVDQGTVCFIAAGNDGLTADHDRVEVPPGGSVFVDLEIVAAPQGGTLHGAFWLQHRWRDATPGDDDIVVKPYEQSTTVPVFQKETDYALSDVSLRGTDQVLQRYRVAAQSGTTGTATLRVFNTATEGPPTVVHFDILSGYGTPVLSWRFADPDPDTKVGQPATADGAIAVGAWSHRGSWVDHLGALHAPGSIEHEGLSAPFTSRGPRIDGRTKPDLAGPGQVTISLLDASPALDFADAYIIDDDGVQLDGSGPSHYRVSQGTSMAAPALAGVAALLLEWQPCLTPGQVRAALLASASQGAAPDDTLGHGLPHAALALEAARPAWTDVMDLSFGFHHTTGLAWGDVDGDGDLDLAGGAELRTRHLLALNPGDAGSPWEDVMPDDLAPALSSGRPLWLDFDGDADLDLLLALADADPTDQRPSPNVLLRNEGGPGGGPPTFTDVTPEVLSDPLRRCVGLSAGDIDGDGDLDLYLQNLEGGRLLRHDGLDGAGSPVLTDVTPAILAGAGPSAASGATVATIFFRAAGPTLGDVDGDGLPDLLVPGHGDVDTVLYRNVGPGAGGAHDFVELASWAGAPGGGRQSGRLVDLDDDGDLDVFVARDGGGHLWIRNKGLVAGSPVFGVVPMAPFDVAAEGFRGAAWGDVDNDGDLDAYLPDLGLGHAGGPADISDVLLLRGEGTTPGGGTHWEPSRRPGLLPGAGLETAWVDVDGDGRLDLVHRHIGGSAQPNQQLRIYRNAPWPCPRGDDHWLAIDLAGLAPNTEAVGARVRVRAGGVDRWRHVLSSTAGNVQVPRRLHFGLGTAEVAEEVEVHWPGGGISLLSAVPADQHLVIDQTAGP